MAATHSTDPLLDGICAFSKDGSTSWQSLKDLKEAYPVTIDEYAVAQGIDNNPAFNWWAHAVLRKREHIIALVKKRTTRFLKKTHKFGIEVPRSVAEAYGSRSWPTGTKFPLVSNVCDVI
jgi:hypothetical protein